jgi:hypothetical protein
MNKTQHLYTATNKYHRFKICTIRMPVWKQLHTIKLVKKIENKMRTLVRRLVRRDISIKQFLKYTSNEFLLLSEQL